MFPSSYVWSRAWCMKKSWKADLATLGRFLGARLYYPHVQSGSEEKENNITIDWQKTVGKLFVAHLFFQKVPFFAELTSFNVEP